MALLTPEYLFKDVTHIRPSLLHSMGVKGLVLDVDNTLTVHDSQELRPEIAAWLQELKDAGFKLMIASNNYEKRVKPFAESIGLEYVHFSCKPSPRWLVAALRKFGCKRSEIALVGDQVFTDMFAGSLYGVRVLMVRPLAQDFKPTILLKRKLEKPFLLRYYKKGGKLL